MAQIQNLTRLAIIHHRENKSSARPEDIDFWLREVRTPELLVASTSRPVPGGKRQQAEKGVRR